MGTVALVRISFPAEASDRGNKTRIKQIKKQNKQKNAFSASSNTLFLYMAELLCGLLMILFYVELIIPAFYSYITKTGLYVFPINKHFLSSAGPACELPPSIYLTNHVN